MHALNSEEKKKLNGKVLEGLDVLRGVAVLGVIWYHTVLAVYDIKPKWGDSVFPKLVDPGYDILFWFSKLGSSGVAMFFVLSGYCIRISAGKQIDLSVFNFYWKRFWRIYPVYFIWLIVFSIMFQPSLMSFLAHLTFTNNLHVNTFISGSINASFWSLPVEFQLYLLYPAIHLLLGKYGVGKALVVTFIVTLCWRQGATYLAAEFLPFCWRGFPLQFWLFWSMGAIVRELHVNKKRLTRKCRPIVLCGFIGVLIASVFVEPLKELGWWLHCPIYCCLLEYAIFDWKYGRGKLIQKIGVISYSAYIIHQPIMTKLIPIFFKSNQIDADFTLRLFCTIASVICIIYPLSLLSYKYLEKNSVMLGQTFFKLILGLKSNFKMLLK